jgi:predicted Zn-dependent protease
MRGRFVWIAGVAAALWLVCLTMGQSPQTAPPPPQNSKESALWKGLAQDLDREGRIDSPALTQYLQRIENRVAAASGHAAHEIRLTRSGESHATLLPHGVLYLSAGLVKRMENEMELAGLLAHQLAHRLGCRTTTA